jgi:peptide/nickel transport system substrate-binding protein
MNRRRFLIAAAAAAGSAALAACGSPTPTPAPAKPAEPAKPAAAEPTKPAAAAAPAATTAPAAAPAATKPAEPAKPAAPAAEPTKPGAAPAAPPQAAAAPAAPSGLKNVPRNRTFITVNGGQAGKFVDHELWSPYAVGATHSAGPSLFYEPLAYYSAYADKEIKFLAETYEYSPDFKTLTIKTRAGVKWSDGKPFSAEDVAYTFDTLKGYGPKVKWGNDVAKFLDTVSAKGDTTVEFKFKVPSPRFMEFITYKYDIGVYIVPKHVFSGQDWGSFKHFDPAKDWPVTTGPWKVAHAAPEQKVMDLRDGPWWAEAAGIQKKPKVERIIQLPVIGEQQTAQGVIANQLDYTYSLQPAGFPAVLKANPKVTTWTGDKPPYGYVDWWPISLWLNNEVKPWDDKDMRWAVSYYIDRVKLADVGWSGASAPSQVPFPLYPPLKPYYDAIKPLLEKYNTNEYNPKKADDILTAKGYKKGGNGVWANAQGPLKLEIMGAGTAGNALGPVLPEMLKQGGLDVTYSQPPDAGTRYTSGNYMGYIVGHPGSVRDIYYTMALYQSASLAVPGGLQNLSKWKNADYDKIVDQVAVTDMNDKAKLTALFKQAMEIWLPELPDVQLTEFHHRIPMNQTYWKNYPTQENPYCNSAFWHLTYGYILPFLEPAQ